jgi:hypothetical protein
MAKRKAEVMFYDLRIRNSQVSGMASLSKINCSGDLMSTTFRLDSLVVFSDRVKRYSDPSEKLYSEISTALVVDDLFLKDIRVVVGA